MFYVSSVVDEERKIGVTDTEDGVEDFFTNKELTKIVHKDKIVVYGASYYNYRVTCTVLELNKKINSSELRKRIENWGRVHNPWTGEPVVNYLAEAKIGTVVTVDYISTSDADRRLKSKGCTVIKKVEDDKWTYEDTSNIASGRTGNSKFAAWTLEVACLYNTLQRIGVL